MVTVVSKHGVKLSGRSGNLPVVVGVAVIVPNGLVGRSDIGTIGGALGGVGLGNRKSLVVATLELVNRYSPRDLTLTIHRLSIGHTTTT